MNKREAVIVSAYTGFLIGDFNDLHKYIEEILKRPVFTYELPFLEDEMKRLSKPDFVKLSENIKG